MPFLRPITPDQLLPTARPPQADIPAELVQHRYHFQGVPNEFRGCKRLLERVRSTLDGCLPEICPLMNRTLGYSLIVLAMAGAAYTASSWWLGQKIETQYNERLDDWANDLKGNYSFLERRYERGIFGAKASLVVQMEVAPPWQDGCTPRLNEDDKQNGDAGRDCTDMAPGGEARKLRFHVSNDIVHGPLPGFRPALAAIHSTLTHIDGIQPGESGNFDFTQVVPPHGVTLVHFDQSTSGKVTLPEGQISNVRNVTDRISWKTLTYDFKVNPDNTRLSGNVIWPEFNLRLGLASLGLSHVRAINLEMKGLRSRFDSELPEIKSVIMPGIYHDDVDSFQLSYQIVNGAPWQNILWLQDIRTDTRVTDKDDILSMEATLDSKGKVGKATLEQFTIKSSLQNLHHGALRDLLQVMQDEQIQDLAQLDPDSPEVAAAVQKLSDARPRLRTVISATADKKSASLSQDIYLQSLERAPFESLNDSFRRAFAIDASLRIPQSWASVLEQAVDSRSLTAKDIEELAYLGEKQRMLVRNGTDWSARLQLFDGVMLLNRQPIGNF